MLDISRDKVPTMPTLFALVDRLAEWKINQLQLYIEHTFAYRGHEEVWRNADPMTPMKSAHWTNIANPVSSSLCRIKTVSGTWSAG